MTDVTVLLCSAGRRPYLVRWFKEAAQDLGLSAEVLLADADSLAPGRAICDRFIVAPLASSDEYESWLQETLAEYDVDLGLSVNDFELSIWASKIPRTHDFASLIRLDATKHHAIEDKFEMARWLEAAGINTPATYLASDFVYLVGEENLAPDAYIIKGRFGSGSKGLAVTSREEFESDLINSSRSVTHNNGALAKSLDEAKKLIVAQRRINGTEYGLDIVADLDGNFVSVLARRKLLMRSGETDKAVTVDANGFVDVAKTLTNLLGHKGLIDVDVILDEKGKIWVIDINPRFGGGYPFSHLSGARIPNSYLSWVAGRDAAASDVEYRSGVVSGKYVETAVVETAVVETAVVEIANE